MLPLSDVWKSIAARAWALLEDRDLTFAVRPSIPILFFGNLDAYSRAPLKIITVGLNPSRHEFPSDDTFRRFPSESPVLPADTSALLAALSAYFRVEPYRSWFASYEPVLNGAGASYYSGHPSTALHTDLFSPIATDPTWSRLTPAQRAPLERAGVEMWHALVRILRPHIVLLSIARRHLERLEFMFDGPWRPLATLTHGRSGPRRKPYVVQQRRASGTMFVFGPAAEKPFGTVAKEDRETIGRDLRRCYDR